MSVLLEKKAQMTIDLLLDAASELCKELDVNDISFKKVADKAEISQRTMFRYFRTREDFLEALTLRLHGELQLPTTPTSLEGLSDYLAKLYRKFDAQPRKVMVLLSAEMHPKVLKTSAKNRFDAIFNLLCDEYGNFDKEVLFKVAANLRYVISASSWHYYRMHYNFDLTTSIECANMMLSQSLNYLNSQE